MLFRDELLNEMLEVIELRQADILTDEEVIGRLEVLLEQFRKKRGVSHRSYYKPIKEVPEPPAGASLICITLVHPDGREEYIEYKDREVTIGRSSDNKLVLKRTDISRRHAKLILYEGRLIVIDLKSENSTFLNGEKVLLPRVVNVGDIIDIGDFSIKIESYYGAENSAKKQ